MRSYRELVVPLTGQLVFFLLISAFYSTWTWTVASAETAVGAPNANANVFNWESAVAVTNEGDQVRSVRAAVGGGDLSHLAAEAELARFRRESWLGKRLRKAGRFITSPFRKVYKALKRRKYNKYKHYYKHNKFNKYKQYYKYKKHKYLRKYGKYNKYKNFYKYH